MQTTLWDDFKRNILHSGNTLNHLLFINIFVFVLFGVIEVTTALVTGTGGVFGNSLFGKFESNYFYLPSALSKLIIRPWTFISYQFLHSGIFHLLVNMLVLFFAGRIFREFLGDKRLLSTYLIGGIVGGIFFIIGYNTIPLFTKNFGFLPLVGASASVMAVLAAIGTKLPNYTVFLILIGPVRLVYIVIVLAIIDYLSLIGTNPGGSLAHLGGLFWGFFYIRALENGRDYGSWVNNVIDWIGAKLKGGRRSRPKFTTYVNQSPPERRKRGKGKPSEAEIDAILDKIAQSGYESLSQTEKDLLFKASQDN